MSSSPVLIFAVDVGRHFGWASGRPGTVPRSGTRRLGGRSAKRDEVAGNLIDFLYGEFSAARPDLVMKESPLPLEAFRSLGNSQSAVRMTYGLHLIVEGMAQRFGVPTYEEADSRIRKHFIGVGRLGTREATKRAVVARCRQLNYVPRLCAEEDRCDALAAWDWASVNLARCLPESLVLFGGDPPETGESNAKSTTGPF